ncbi:peptidase inhibitor family I36 protein [Actinoplanes sp. CA-054009]
MKAFTWAAAALLSAAAGLVGTVAPAQAAATCPQGHICFFQNTSFTGSMSDQTNPLIYGSQKIDVFWNSHYTNGQNINDSISSVVNNTGSCIQLNANFYQDQGNWRNTPIQPWSGYVAIGPQTSVSFDQRSSWTFGDIMSSASANRCHVGAHSWAGTAWHDAVPGPAK